MKPRFDIHGKQVRFSQIILVTQYKVNARGINYRIVEPLTLANAQLIPTIRKERYGTE